MKRVIQNSHIMFLLVLTMSCTSYSRNHEKPNLSGKGDMYRILYYASLAGSAHNTQPWKAEVYGEDSILVYADATRMLPVVDRTGRELFISIGAFIENLNLAANCLGYRAVIRINPSGEPLSKPLASVRFYKTTGLEQPIHLADVERRTTLRIPFDTLPVRRQDWESLVNLEPGYIHFFPSPSSQGKFIAKKEYEAYAQQSRNDQAKEELANWIRFSNKDVKEKRDGLTPAGMGIKGIGGFVVRTTFKPEDSKKASFVEQGIEKTKIQTEHCGGWILITHGQDDREGWIQVGRLYERININCRKLQLGFHPMNQIIEEKPFENQLSGELKLGQKILFVARIGYVDDYPDPVSLRRSVESFSIFKPTAVRHP